MLRMCHRNVPREADFRCGVAVVINITIAWSGIRINTRSKVINHCLQGRIFNVTQSAMKECGWCHDPHGSFLNLQQQEG